MSGSNNWVLAGGALLGFAYLLFRAILIDPPDTALKRGEWRKTLLASIPALISMIGGLAAGGKGLQEAAQVTQAQIKGDGNQTLGQGQQSRVDVGGDGNLTQTGSGHQIINGGGGAYSVIGAGNNIGGAMAPQMPMIRAPITRDVRYWAEQAACQKRLASATSQYWAEEEDNWRQMISNPNSQKLVPQLVELPSAPKP